MLRVLGLKIVYRQWNSHLPCFRKMTHTSQLHGQKISAAIKFPFVSSLGANGLDPCLCFASHVPALSLRYSLVEIFRNKSEHKQDKTALSSSFNWMLYIASSVNISSWHYFLLFSCSLVHCWGWTNKVHVRVRRRCCDEMQVSTCTIRYSYWLEGYLALDEVQLSSESIRHGWREGAPVIPGSGLPGQSEASHWGAAERLGRVTGHYWQWHIKFGGQKMG